MIQHFTLRLVQSLMLAPTVRHFAFERVDGEPLQFQPGQFIQIHFTYPDGKPTKRSYSIATLSIATNDSISRIEIAVSFVPGGAASDLLEQLIVGDTVAASGPYGRFVLFNQDRNRRYLLVATGTGITPYRAMLTHLEAMMQQRELEVVLLYGARNPEELLYDKEFAAFASGHPGFRFVPCLSRQMRSCPGPDERRGYVQAVLPEFDPNPEGDIVYLCGNPNMVDATFATLKEAGFPVAHLRREKYVSAR